MASVGFSVRGRRRAEWGSRTSGRRAAALALLFALCAFGPSQSLAQQAVEVKAEDLASTDAFNQPIFVDAKVVLVSANTLLVRDSDVSLILKPPLASLAETLREGENIRAWGQLARAATGSGRVFFVERLERRADDLSLFREEIDKAKAKNDRAALLSVAGRAEREYARTREAAMRELATEAYRAGIALEAAAAQPDDAAAAIRLADLYAKKLGDRRSALDWLLKAFPKGQFPPPEVRDRLTSKEVNAVPYAGEWVLYEEMKKREGFVLRGEEWVLAERAAFLDAIDQQIKEPRRDRVKSDPDFLIDAAKAGQVILGMLKREVAIAIGFPDDVDRVRRLVAGQQRVYDAWIYEGRGQYVFEDDVLIRKP
jgi:hypothetical protein